MQIGMEATQYTVLKTIIMSAFVSAVLATLLTRLLLAFPISALFVFFFCSTTPQIAPTWAIQTGCLIGYLLGHESEC